MILEITGSKEIVLQFDGSGFLPFLNIGFTFAILQALGKEGRLIGYKEQKLSLLECQHHLLKPFPKVYLLQQLLISCMIFKTCFSVVPTRQKSTVIP